MNAANEWICKHPLLLSHSHAIANWCINMMCNNLYVCAQSNGPNPDIYIYIYATPGLLVNMYIHINDNGVVRHCSFVWCVLIGDCAALMCDGNRQ